MKDYLFKPKLPVGFRLYVPVLLLSSFFFWSSKNESSSTLLTNNCQYSISYDLETAKSVNFPDGIGAGDLSTLDLLETKLTTEKNQFEICLNAQNELITTITHGPTVELHSEWMTEPATTIISRNTTEVFDEGGNLLFSQQASDSSQVVHDEATSLFIQNCGIIGDVFDPITEGLISELIQLGYSVTTLSDGSIKVEVDDELTVIYDPNNYRVVYENYVDQAPDLFIEEQHQLLPNGMFVLSEVIEKQYVQFYSGPCGEK